MNRPSLEHRQEAIVELLQHFVGGLLWRAGQIEFSSGDVILGMLFHPRVIEARVVGNEVEQELQTSLAKMFSEPRQRRIASQITVHGIAGDGKAGPGDVLFPQVRQGFLNSLRHYGLLREILCPTGRVCQTLRNQTQSKPVFTSWSNSASGISSNVAG